MMINRQTRAGRPGPSESPQHIEQRMNADSEERRVPSLLTEAVMNTWNPFGNTDTTIHLALDVQDDLDSALDDLSRLSRLGDFTSARALFHEALESHLDKPQVLIRWGETLLRQGDYKGVLSINSGPIENLGAYGPNSEAAKLAKLYWRLMRLEARYQSLKINAASEEWNVLDDVMKYPFEDIIPGSTEINMLVLFGRVARYQTASILLFPKMETRLTATWFRRLYSELLRQGRVWDMHDLFMVSFNINESIASYTTNLAFSLDEPPHSFSLRRILERLIQDWQVPEYDESTALALLDVVSTCLTDMVLKNRNAHTDPDAHIESIFELSVHLSQSVMRNDPDNMRSRPFTKWLLCKAIWEEFKRSDCSKQIQSNLAFARGLGYYPSPDNLPMYVPASDENPGWMMNSAPAQFKDIVELVTNVARSQEDHMMEAIYLTQLIHLTSNPAAEFARLLHLQKDISRSIIAYHRSLAACYLFCNAEDTAKNLQVELDIQLNKHIVHDAETLWLLSRLRFSLGGYGESVAFWTADSIYRFLPHHLQYNLERKIPHIRNRKDRSPRASTPPPFNLYECRGRRRMTPLMIGDPQMDNRSRVIPHSYGNNEEVTREGDFQESIIPQSEAPERRDGAQLFLPQNDPDDDEQHIYTAITGRQNTDRAKANRNKKFIHRIPVFPLSSHIRRPSHSRGRSRSSRQSRSKTRHSPTSDRESDWESEPEEDDDHDKSPDYRQPPIATAERPRTANQGELVLWRPPTSNEEPSPP